MNAPNFRAAVRYLLERAQDKEIPVGKTRLVKLLYLLDVEVYRLCLSSFTGLDWIFYKYGPYSHEVEAALSQLDISEVDIPIGGSRVFQKLGIDLEEDASRLEIETKAAIERLLAEWGTADLNELLDHVYFETEPMLKAEFKQRLDFSTIRPKETKAERIVLSDEAKNKLQELGVRLCAKLERIEVPDDPLSIVPFDLIGNVNFLREEMVDLSAIVGKVRIKNA